MCTFLTVVGGGGVNFTVLALNLQIAAFLVLECLQKTATNRGLKEFVKSKFECHTHGH